MADVEVRDVLLRVGGRTLHRTGCLAAMGAGRGYVEVKETFTRAGVRRFRDRDVANGTVALGRKATNDKIAIEYPAGLSGLVDSAGLPYCGPLLYPARTQLVTNPENFGAWAPSVPGPVLTAGQADPFGGTAAYLINDDDAANEKYITTNPVFTGDGEKSIAIWCAQGTSPAWHFGIHNGAVWRHGVTVTWNAGVPVVATLNGAGTRFAPENWGGGLWRIPISVLGVVAAEGNTWYIRPCLFGNANIGTVRIFGANAWDSPFPGAYQGPGEAGVADALLSVFNQGPGDVTVLTRVARPYHADSAGDLGIEPATFRMSTAVPRVRGNFQQVGRLVRSFLSSTGLDVQQTVAIPAGNPLAWITQYRNFSTAPLTRLDVGTGLTADSPAANAIAAFGNQVLEVGANTATHVLSGVLLDLMFIRGQRTLAEALAVP